MLASISQSSSALLIAELSGRRKRDTWRRGPSACRFGVAGELEARGLVRALHAGMSRALTGDAQKCFGLRLAAMPASWRCSAARLL